MARLLAGPRAVTETYTLGGWLRGCLGRILLRNPTTFQRGATPRPWPVSDKAPQGARCMLPAQVTDAYTLGGWSHVLRGRMLVEQSKPQGGHSDAPDTQEGIHTQRSATAIAT